MSCDGTQDFARTKMLRHPKVSNFSMSGTVPSSSSATLTNICPAFFLLTLATTVTVTYRTENVLTIADESTVHAASRLHRHLHVLRRGVYLRHRYPGQELGPRLRVLDNADGARLQPGVALLGHLRGLPPQQRPRRGDHPHVSLGDLRGYECGQGYQYGNTTDYDPPSLT